MSAEQIIQLRCDCNQYPWGRQGKESLAAKYAASTPGGDFKLDESKPYAEMWMGTYPTLPSKILKTGEDLQQHLNANKEKLIGKPILDKFGADLPYLPKILSISKALPLQLHPNKDIAAKLHKQDPEKYGDSNHKPEISVALGKFETFVGFLPLDQIKTLFTKIPILQKKFLSSSSSEFTNETLRSIVHKMLSLPDDEIVEIYNTLKDTPASDFGSQSYVPELLPRLASQYDKSDPGNLVALLTMNFLVLDKGDAIYIPADGIHAYLSGDIVECMARSDNVLNTGFCPRADRDSVDTFTEALTFSPMGKDECLLKPKPSEKSKEGNTKVLAPPMSEFNMLITELGAGGEEKIKAIEGPSIMVVTAGGGTLMGGEQKVELKEGYVFFVGCGTEMHLKADENLEVHVAYCVA